VKDTEYAKVTIRQTKGKYAVRTDLPTQFDNFFITLQVMEHQKVGLSEHDELKDT
jgi:hypothetical protein